MLHSALLQVTTKYYQTPTIQVLWLSRASRLLPGKPTSSWGPSEAAPLSSLGTSLQERKGLLQSSHRTGSVPVAQPTVPCMCLCESHSTSRVALLEPALPSCLTASLKPLPQLFLPTTAGRQKVSRSNSQRWISSFLLLLLAPSPHYSPHPNTIPSLQCRPGFLTLQHHHSDLQVTLQVTLEGAMLTDCRAQQDSCATSHTPPPKVQILPLLLHEQL